MASLEPIGTILLRYTGGISACLLSVTQDTEKRKHLGRLYAQKFPTTRKGVETRGLRVSARVAGVAATYILLG